MAKKKMTPAQPPAPSATPAPRRRTSRKSQPASAAAKASPAAAPVDIAPVTAIEPIVGPNGREPSHDEIAEAAYFRHLNGGEPSGDPFIDWVEAERELRERREQ